MRKLWQLLLLCGLVYIVGIPNADLSAASTSPQMALMYIRYKGNDQYDSYFSIVETVGNKLKEVDYKVTKTAYSYASWSPKAEAILFIEEISDTKDVLVIKRADGTENTLEYITPAIDLSPAAKSVLRVNIKFLDGGSVDYYLDVIGLDNKTQIIYVAKTGDPFIGYIGTARWSPDGEYIAFDGRPHHELRNGHIFLLSTKCLSLHIASCPVEKLRIKDGSGIRLKGSSEIPRRIGENQCGRPTASVWPLVAVV